MVSICFSSFHALHVRRGTLRVRAQAPPASQEPAMRSLSSEDTARSLLSRSSQPNPSKPPGEKSASTSSHNGQNNIDSRSEIVVPKGIDGSPGERVVPMVYKGLDGSQQNGMDVHVQQTKSQARNSNVLTQANDAMKNVSRRKTNSIAERAGSSLPHTRNEKRDPSGVATAAAGTSSKHSTKNVASESMPETFSTSTSASKSRGFSRTMMVAGFDEETTDSDISAEGSFLGFKPQVPKQYDWENYSRTRRTFDTWTFILLLRARLWSLDQKWTYPGGYSESARSKRARTLAIWIRETLLQLGPTFIKVGQLFSTRSDLFPSEFVEELSKLQDRVPAFSADRAIETVERELGAPLNQLFADFDPQPIAAASLGQVHLATLKSGEKVVVKVQRPGLKRLFDIDLENLRKVAEQLDKGDDAAGVRDFKGIYEECATILYQEIDYINEGRNADLFRRNFRPQEWVRVPRVHWQRTSAAVLTMEYAPGIKITDVDTIRAAGLDAPSVARRATEAYLIQILKHGFFHADPHPGNIAVDNVGRLIFYDFGMMGTIANATRERLLDLFYAIAKKDVDALLLNLTELGIIAPTSSDTISLRRALSYFVDNIGRQAEQQETVAAIGEDLFAIALDSPFRFPATFTFVLRAFATLEGIGKALDPTFSFAATAAPYAQELLDLQDGRARSTFLLGQLQTQAVEMGAAAAAVPLRVQRIERTIASLEAGDIKLRVRVLEGERAARRAGVMQSATLSGIGSIGMLNVGVQLALAGNSVVGGVALLSSGVFAVLMLLSLRRVRRLDKFEDGIKGRGKFPSS